MPDPSGSPAGGESTDDPEARARSRALRLLARREKSRRGVEEALRRAGYSGDVRRKVVEGLVAQGLIDDARYCRLYLGQQARVRPRSLRALRHDLGREGIDRVVIERTLDEMGAELAEPALAEAAARRKLRASGADPDRLRRLLAARGFGRATVEAALQKVLGEAREDKLATKGREAPASDEEARREDEETR